MKNDIVAVICRRVMPDGQTGDWMIDTVQKFQSEDQARGFWQGVLSGHFATDVFVPDTGDCCELHAFILPRQLAGLEKKAPEVVDEVKGLARGLMELRG